MSNNPIGTVFENVRSLLQDPSHWTQGCLARDFYGQETMPESINANCWCLLGAVVKETIGHARIHCAAAFILKEEVPFGLTIGNFNDVSTHADVIKYLDNLIQNQDHLWNTYKSAFNLSDL